MSQPMDTCPTCGERSLIAVCRTTVEYAIANECEDDQDWSRRAVEDETSEPTSFRCDSCGAEFSDFTLNDDGYLTSLRQGEGQPEIVPADLHLVEGPSDEVLVVIHIGGGLVADVGCRRRDIPRLRVVVVDEDVAETEEDPEQAYWTETPTAVEDWPLGPTDPLSRARTELPEDLVAELGIDD